MGSRTQIPMIRKFGLDLENNGKSLKVFKHHDMTRFVLWMVRKKRMDLNNQPRRICYHPSAESTWCPELWQWEWSDILCGTAHPWKVPFQWNLSLSGRKAFTMGFKQMLPTENGKIGSSGMSPLYSKFTRSFSGIS